jgi:hypothetical protein
MKSILACLILAVAVAVAGCAPPQDRAKNECLNQGFTPGTANFGQCYQATMARYQQVNMYLIQTGLGMMSNGR